MRKILSFFSAIMIALNVCSQSPPNWSLVYSSPQNNIINSLSFLDSTVGFAIDGNQMLRSNDSGQSWNVDTSLSAFDDYLSLNILDSFIYIGVKDSSSQLRLDKYDLSFNLIKTIAQIPSEAFLLQLKKANGMLLAVNAISSTDLSCIRNDSVIQLLNRNLKWEVGINGNNLAVSSLDSLFLSSDNGISWNSIPHFSLHSGSFHQIFYDGSDTIYFNEKLFPSSELVSYDGGASWQNWSVRPSPVEYFRVRKDYFLGIAAARNEFYKSTDRGFTFTVDTMNLAGVIDDLFIKNESEVFLTAANGEVYKSNSLGGLVGIKEIPLSEQSIKLFPNPTRDRLSISTNVNISQIEVYDINGRLVNKLDNGLRELDFTNQEEGTYFIHLTAKGQTIKKKVIVIH